jgi:serine/threonine-protein kinase
VDGTEFGRYRLVDMLGRGGMGEVWRAFDTSMNRVVALKVLPASFAHDTQFQMRFRREAQVAAALDEPHVVPIHDFGEIDGRLYVTMRLIDGKTIQELLESGPLPPERAVWIVEQIAAALNAAHRVGLVHRDVKPSNILVTDDDFAYLIDFGIARAAEATKLTDTGATIGTLAYMAPERFTSDVADARSDVYALTCVLYECLTGSQPFPGDSLERQITSHLTLPPPRPSMVQPGVSPQMDHVIATGMAKNPDERYASTKDLAAAARAALSPTPAGQPAPAMMNWTPPVSNWQTPQPYPATGPSAAPAGPSTQQPMTGEPSVWPPIPVPDSQSAQTGRPWWRGPAILIPAALLAILIILGTILVVTWPSGNSKQQASSPTQQDRPSIKLPSFSIPTIPPITNVPGQTSSSSAPQGPTQLQTADGLTGLLAGMRDRFGDTMGFRLVIYPDYAVTNRPDPANTHVEQGYTYRKGAWQTFGPATSTSTLDILADLSAFDAGAVAKTLADAPQTIGARDGSQMYLIVEGASGGGLKMSIHSLAPGVGFMQVNTDGTVAKTFPP